MKHPGWRAWIATQFDDYIEETAIGRRRWWIVLLFGVGMGLVMGVLEVFVPSWYHPGDVGIGVVIGLFIGTALVLIARERQRARSRSVDHTRDIAALKRMPWGEFEVLIGEIARKKGFLVKDRGGLQRDFGTDLIAERGSERVIIQCKHWSGDVRERDVKVLYADMVSQGFTQAWLVTSGRFDGYARSWAKGKQIVLIDGSEVAELLPIPQVESERELVPKCPNCGERLDRLTNHHTQMKFWGCHKPGCQWTLDDAPRLGAKTICSFGHPMIRATTGRGTGYWRCTVGTCTRKRLSG
jgi:ssDNA-binding Zn-finger/Zn-ribbon topoisomerase 1